MSQTKIVALVVTYNRKELLQRCLDAILCQEYPVDRIIVIDNASTDGTETLFATEAKYDSRILYRRMSKNLGGAGGFKQGLQIASTLECDWVWLMDDDCIAYPDTLFNLVAAAKKAAGRISFLASSVYGPNNEPMNVPVVDPTPAQNGYADWYRNLDNGMVRIQSATFVSLLINHEAILQVGLPIGSFFIWGDDTEYTNRLTRYYGQAYVVGASKILHYRKGAKSLDIRNETNASRIHNYKYHVRNNLVVARYYQGRMAALKRCIKELILGITILTARGNAKLKLSRFNSIMQGTINYLLHRYDLEDLAILLSQASDGKTATRMSNSE